ncbi:putative lipid II flippase FtsW [Metallococcus carri]|uniref:putative lipid II flippase FtsW n=1 Tax=Metallococcus carri TaxID=1656884 RepID=UPI002E287334|nr:putative lipid II flippase FtsW [Metallococcus carri]
MTTASPTKSGFDARSFSQRLTSPVAPYYLLLGATTLLLVFGLIMVLSASSVTSYAGGHGSAYAVFNKQAMFAVIGVIAAVIAARLPVAWWKRLAFPIYGLALALQMLVFSPLGVNVLGNTNWIRVAGFTMQPSEMGKLAIVLICAVVLERKRRHLARPKHVLIVLVPMVLLLLGLVMAGHDLGTTMVLALTAGAVLWVAGLNWKFFGGALAVAVVALGAAVKFSGNRSARFDAWLGTCVNEHTAGCYQKVHGLYAMADGGWWGVGLGASREKWFWLPEAHNDFIFAIVGEELGLPGTLAVIGLYAVLGYACYRLIATSKDFFVRLATAGVMAWILAQAMINIGSVIGLLPIIGVPLPLMSSGGSALVMALVGLGMVISFARNEPECKAALAQRPSMVRRTLAVMPTHRNR